MSHLSTPDLRGTILCRCDREMTVNRTGVVRKHDGCGFSGMRLTPDAVDKRQIALSDRIRANSKADPRFTARGLGIIK